MSARRVVITGLGLVTPLGCGVDTTWRRILDGQSGARKIDTFEVSDLASQIACVIPRGDGSGGTFNPDQWMEPKDRRKVDDFIIYAMAAAAQALTDAGWPIIGGWLAVALVAHLLDLRRRWRQPSLPASVMTPSASQTRRGWCRHRYRSADQRRCRSDRSSA